MKIAAAAYPLDFHGDFAGFAAKTRLWVAEAAAAGADLLVFPEYGLMEQAGLGGRKLANDLEASLHEVARHRPATDALFAGLAREHGLYILGPSGPVFDTACHPDRPVNRASLFGPDGLIGHQDKQMMTRFERETWDVVAGGPLRVFETTIGRIGVLICYDSEFPLLGRALIEAGAEIILVPSCTDSLAGYTRVRTGAMARALEGQCITVHSPTVGDCVFCLAVDENVGRAAIYGPADRGFPETGILAETALNAPGWAIAEVSLEAVHAVRRSGNVFNHTHWPEQAARAAQRVKRG
ncbi:carbon-nitrogen hydrolase family protein [Tabrizicola fusiformis]|uniref:carbon-nitrogen hydrolase family protein n=1 Tax=Tabrizicola sp. SY72 TaxID=2741673 RepID=UPI0015731693|nr:carbon-nitrogen hydrolase family protein [Tabrizicola sp. SY72]NTT85992.1 carbon-nitrogen hydrolase family protein [Tabrizicola sp. SY72]